LLEQQRRTVDATERFKTDLGTVRTKIEGLSELQTRVGELNDLLKPQQLRGELGEVIVRNLLADKLPKQYEEDYTFSDGKKVEFVIRLNDKLIPVDSKLQLEDFKRMREADERQRQVLRTEFKRTVRQKIDEVKQYIRPEEGTANFALMMIPSEAVFYELVAAREFTEEGGLYEYAQAHHVFLTSPLTFWAYLTTIAQGLKGLEIERRAEDVLSALQTLAADIRNFASDEFRKLGGHLRNASSQYEEAERTLRNIEHGLTNLERVESPTRQGATL
jgi:DNA recombination protein RmuC